MYWKDEDDDEADDVDLGGGAVAVRVVMLRVFFPQQPIVFLRIFDVVWHRWLSDAFDEDRRRRKRWDEEQALGPGLTE